MPSTSGDFTLTAFQPMVVEPFPIRDLAADYPIYIIFKHSHLGVFHPYVVANIALGTSSNSKGYTINLSKYSGLSIMRNFNITLLVISLIIYNFTIIL